MAANTETAEITATPCECSNFSAQILEQLTEENLANGNYDTFTTGCNASTKREFAPGHDAKLKSFLIAHGAAGHDIIRGIEHGTAESWAKRYTFGYMILDGIAKARDKAQAKADRDAAKAERKASKPKKAERKLAESAGVVADETTHDGNEARKAREAKSLAEIVAAEEAKHEAEQAASRPEPEWDDTDEASAPILEDEAAMNTAAREEREAGLVKAKVGRWTQEGYVNEDGSFTYAKRSGGTKTVAAGKFQLV